MVMKSGNCKRSEIVRERTTGRTFLQFLTCFKLRISGEGCSSASVVLNRPPSREIFLEGLQIYGVGARTLENFLQSGRCCWWPSRLNLNPLYILH